MDKIDGPHYFFPVLGKLAKLPRFTPIVLPDSGRTNIVPVDYVVDALVALLHAEGAASWDGRTFHLTAPRAIGLRGICRAIAGAAGLPPLRGSLPRSVATTLLNVRGRAKVVRNMAATIPAEVLDVVDLAPTFTADATRKALQGSGIDVPEFADYAAKLWRYWAEHLDPDRARREDPAGPLVGRHVIITGASSGIGRASAIAWPTVERRSSRWPATPQRSTSWSPRSARTAAKPTRSSATSPIPRRWSTPSRTSWAGSTTSTTW